MGFDHEQNHFDNNGDCTTGLGSTGDEITEYDHNSVMNYCGDHGNAAGRLTGLDVEGAQAVYGMGKRFVAAMAAAGLT